MAVLTAESSAGTGEKDVSIPIDNLVVTAITLSNPNVGTRAEASRIELYEGTKKEGIVVSTLESGWTLGNHVLRWTGRLNLLGSWTLVGTINHAASVKHRFTVLAEPKGAMPQGLWNWNWAGRR